MEEKQKEMDWKEALNVMREQHVAVRRKGWSGEKYIFFVPECDLLADTYTAMGFLSVRVRISEAPRLIAR